MGGAPAHSNITGMGRHALLLLAPPGKTLVSLLIRAAAAAAEAAAAAAAAAAAVIKFPGKPWQKLLPLLGRALAPIVL